LLCPKTKRDHVFPVGEILFIAKIFGDVSNGLVPIPSQSFPLFLGELSTPLPPLQTPPVERVDQLDSIQKMS
jgi:hypothetical protein